MVEAEGSGRTVTAPLANVAEQQEFLTRCDLAARVSVHAHVVTISDFGVGADGTGYLTTDPPPGATLAANLASEGAFSLAASLRIGVTLAGALETAHRAGLVHGAVSPANVVLGPSREPFLTGLVRTGGEEVRDSSTPGLIASSQQSTAPAASGEAAEHAPPEVLRGDVPTPASDVHALASVVYTMVAGRTPSAARALASAGGEGAAEGYPPIMGRSLPVALNYALERALLVDLELRTASVLDLAEALRDIQRQLRHPVTEPEVLEITAPAQAQAEAPVPSSSGWPEQWEAHGAGGAVGVPPVPQRPLSGGPETWWRSPWVYVGAAATVLLLVGVVAILRSTDGDDAEEADPPSGSGQPAATTGASDPDSGDGGASDETVAPEDEDGSSTDEDSGELVVPRNLSAVESEIGVQLDWESEGDGPYVVLAMPEGGDARFLPSSEGLTQLVPSDQLLPEVGYCFAVAHLEHATSSPDDSDDTEVPGVDADDADTDAFSEPACIRDATVESTG